MKIIEIVKFILIGFVQGISEVLPISSSAHLLIIGSVLDLNVDITLEIILHFASLISVVFFMRKKIGLLIKEIYLFVIKKEMQYKKSFLYVIYLIVSSLILVFTTLLINDYIEMVFNRLYIVGILLVINGIILFLFTGFTRNKNEIKFRDSIIIGLFESIGVFPGISRSGITLSGCNVCGINKDEASDYAFLLFIPATLGAFVYKIDSFDYNFIKSNIYGYILGFFTTIIVTYLSFSLLLKIIKKRKINIFGYYCIIVGLIVYLLNI